MKVKPPDSESRRDGINTQSSPTAKLPIVPAPSTKDLKLLFLGGGRGPSLHSGRCPGTGRALWVRA